MPAEKDGKRTIWVAVIGASATIIAALLSYLAVTGARGETKLYSGIVRNAAEQPIPRAKVSIAEDGNGPETLRTDSKGVFYKELSKKTRHILITVEADGYKPYTSRESADRSEPDEIILGPVSDGTQAGAIAKLPDAQPGRGGPTKARNSVPHTVSPLASSQATELHTVIVIHSQDLPEDALMVDGKRASASIVGSTYNSTTLQLQSGPHQLTAAGTTCSQYFTVPTAQVIFACDPPSKGPFDEK